MSNLDDLRSPDWKIIVWIQVDSAWHPFGFKTIDDADDWITNGNTHSSFCITPGIIRPRPYPGG